MRPTDPSPIVNQNSLRLYNANCKNRKKSLKISFLSFHFHLSIFSYLCTHFSTNPLTFFIFSQTLCVQTLKILKYTINFEQLVKILIQRIFRVGCTGQEDDNLNKLT